MFKIYFPKSKNRQDILWFSQLTNQDVALVGGKNASLGEMYRKLTKKGINVPNGFAVTAKAYQHFLKINGLTDKINSQLKNLEISKIESLQKIGSNIRRLISNSKLPQDLEDEIVKAYQKLSAQYHAANIDVAVRSSATAEDLPDASFAGQQATFLNIDTKEKLLRSVKDCYASLFTDRAISYREDKGFDHLKVYLSVGVQKMVRSDKACSGVAFTLDPDTGFKDVIVINSTWGLGELIVQGKIIPDEFEVFKPTFKKGFGAIITKNLGTKNKTMIYTKDGVKTLPTTLKQQKHLTLSEAEILLLSKWAVEIENHYKKPMDIEWAKDGLTGNLYIVQARPETIHKGAEVLEVENYHLSEKSKVLIKGIAVGTKIASGRANIIKDAKEINKFKEGEVLVTKITDPDWEPIMKIAAAIITDEGGRTSHAAIVSRELGIPCIVGTQNATEIIKMHQQLTVDCSSGSEGVVYEGKCQWEVKKYSLKNLKRPKVKVMVNVGSPAEAFKDSFLPNDGVGLAREEFIIASYIKIHPLALINYDSLEDEKIKAQIDSLTAGFEDRLDYYRQKLAQGIAKIGAAFYPKDVIVRFSDFKTNEYASLIGGAQFEPEEENPMLGFRGASRYYDAKFERAFGLECEAIRIARNKWGLKNIIMMIPFCRTVEEGLKVLKIMEKYGLKRGKDGLQVYMMAEIPSDIILAKDFLKLFDGFSIGSNDLTQLTLGIDRDNAALSNIANEQNQAVKILIEQVIKVCKKNKKYIGICGQAPSDYPEFAKFLIDLGIDSISLNPDTVVKTTLELGKKIV